MKKFFAMLTCLICLFGICSCSQSNSTNNNVDSSSDNQCATRHEVNLTLDNLTDYVTVVYTRPILHNQMHYAITFEGALKHAIYDDCIIEYNKKGTNEYLTLKLNKGGIGVTEYSLKNELIITSVSGKVTYIM